MIDRIGKTYRFILIGDRYYTGVILEESESLITIKDKFDKEVSVGKNTIISMEVIL